MKSRPNFPKLSRKMYDQSNNKNSGAFIVESKSILIKTVTKAYRDVHEGTVVYLKDGFLHNEEGPAIIELDSARNYRFIEFWQNGELFRKKGPSKICFKSEGSFAQGQFVSPKNPTEIHSFTYTKNGFIHNINGPAVYDLFEMKKYQYFIEGIEYAYDEFNIRAEEFLKTERLKNKMTEAFKVENE